jgi:hypothetical protein
VTSPLSSVFIALHHNVTVPDDMGPSGVHEFIFYNSGLKDFPAIFFYLLIAIVMHQIIQEYLLDKVSRFALNSSFLERVVGLAIRCLFVFQFKQAFSLKALDVLAMGQPNNF